MPSSLSTQTNKKCLSYGTSFWLVKIYQSWLVHLIQPSGITSTFYMAPVEVNYLSISSHVTTTLTPCISFCVLIICMMPPLQCSFQTISILLVLSCGHFFSVGHALQRQTSTDRQWPCNFLRNQPDRSLHWHRPGFTQYTPFTLQIGIILQPIIPVGIIFVNFLNQVKVTKKQPISVQK